MELPSMVQRTSEGKLLIRSLVSGSVLYPDLDDNRTQDEDVAVSRPDGRFASIDTLERKLECYDNQKQQTKKSNQFWHKDEISPKSQSLLTSPETSISSNISGELVIDELPQCKIKRNYSCNHCEFFTQNPRNHLMHLRDVHGEKIIINECKLCLYASRHFQKLVRHMKMVHGCTDGLTSAAGQGPIRGKRAGISREVRKRMLEESISTDPNTTHGQWPSLKQMRQELHIQEKQLARDIAKYKRSEDQQYIDSGANLFALAYEIQQQAQKHWEQQSLNILLSEHKINFNTTLPNETVMTSEVPQTSSKKKASPARTEKSKKSVRASGSQKRLLKCKHCDFKTANCAEMAKHELEKQCKQVPYRCENCSYETPIKARFRKHVKYHSMPMIKCTSCDFKSPYKWNLDRHTRSHGANGRYKCSVCDFSADIKQSLTIHELHHHEPPVENGMVTTAIRRRGRMATIHPYPIVNDPKKVDLTPAAGSEQITVIKENQDGEQNLENQSDVAESSQPNLSTDASTSGTNENTTVDDGTVHRCHYCQQTCMSAIEHLNHLQQCDLAIRNAQELYDMTPAKISTEETPKMMPVETEKKPETEPEIPSQSQIEHNCFYGVETAPGYGEITELPNDLNIPNVLLKRVYKCPDCSFWAATASRFHVHIVGHLNKKPFECSQCAYRSNWRWDITKHIRLKAVRDVLHRGSKVLMNDETGRRNYTKYNKYITQIRLTGDLTDPKLLRTGDVMPIQATNNTNNKISNNEIPKEEFPTPINDTIMEANYSDENGIQQQKPQQQLNIYHDTNIKNRILPLGKPSDDLITEVHLENSIKKFFYNCRRCNFKHQNRDAVLAHVIIHYRKTNTNELTSGMSLNEHQPNATESEGIVPPISTTINTEDSKDEPENSPMEIDEHNNTKAEMEIMPDQPNNSSSSNTSNDSPTELSTEDSHINELQTEGTEENNNSIKSISQSTENFMNQNVSNVFPYRCGHCHQGSNWKHVIQRHCRLKHDGDIRIETLEHDNSVLPTEPIIEASSGCNNKSPNQNDNSYTKEFLEPEDLSVATTSTPKVNNKKQQKCSQCDFVSGTKALLKQHLAEHKLKQYKCSFCSFACSKKLDISSHLRLKHQLKAAVANAVASQTKANKVATGQPKLMKRRTSPIAEQNDESIPQQQPINLDSNQSETMDLLDPIQEIIVVDNDGPSTSMQSRIALHVSNDLLIQPMPFTAADNNLNTQLQLPTSSQNIENRSTELQNNPNTSTTANQLTDGINESQTLSPEPNEAPTTSTRVYHRISRGNVVHPPNNTQTQRTNIILVNAKTGEIVARK